MAFNGLGTFSRLYSWANDAAAGIKIRADRSDDELNGFAAGLSTAICKDGQTTTTAVIPFAAGMSSTTGAFSGAVTVTGQLVGGGTTTNDAAAAGVIGQLIKTTVTSGSAIALTSTTTVNVATIALTAGDWDVSGVVHFTGGATTTISTASAAISPTSLTFPSYGAGDTDRCDSPSYGAGTPFSAGGIDCVMGPTRVSLAGAATYYLIAVSVFGVSTCSVFGTIRARRVR